MGMRGLKLLIMYFADAVRKIFCFLSHLPWADFFFLMVQGFPSLAINCMQILFLCVCLVMTVCVCECVCVSSEAKPKREAVPLKQNWKKCLQASYYSGMSQGSGFAAQLYKPSRIWLIWPVCLTVKRFFHTHTHTHTHTELGITTSLSFDRTATIQKLIADFNIFISWRLLAAGSNLCQSL